MSVPRVFWAGICEWFNDQRYTALSNGLDRELLIELDSAPVGVSFLHTIDDGLFDGLCNTFHAGHSAKLENQS